MIASAHHLRQSVESLFDGIDKSIFKRGFMLDNIEKISFIDYRLRIQERVLLRNINLEFHKKIIYAISGPVGSGKSSLLKCLTRAMTDFSGDIIFNEQYKIQDVDCNFFHHNVASLDMESDFVSGSIYHNFSIRGQRDKNIITGIVKKIMKDDLVDYEYIFNKDVFSIKMSTGQKRKLLISMALSQSKSIYIFDEVLSNMSNQDILELFREFKSSIDCPFVFIVSHDPSVLNMADVHYEISNGMLKRSKTSVINVGGK
jgi:ABC-type bacteriocin/lantibiotic exporter with double-glycine peptidase domain